MTNLVKSSIHLQDLLFDVHLGWSEAERSTTQSIGVNIEIQFAEPPLACQTDLLVDTYCYDDLIARIDSQLRNTQIKLIEHLAQQIYLTLKKHILTNNNICVSVTKKIPIPGIRGNASFAYGDMDAFI